MYTIYPQKQILESFKDAYDLNHSFMVLRNPYKNLLEKFYEFGKASNILNKYRYINNIRYIAY